MLMNNPVKPFHISVLCAAMMMVFLTSCHAEPQPSPANSVRVADVVETQKMPQTSMQDAEIVVDSGPDLEFRGTISGDVLDFNDGKGDDTPAVKQFKKTGINPYNGIKVRVDNGYTIFSTACSGCHGHLAEGKLGPALADSYWTYPGNKKDKGLFETIYGGAQGMMGPQKGMLPKDEILQVMSWIRSLNSGDEKKPH